MHRADIAVSLVFGTSVAFLSLIFGLASYLTPMQSLPATKKVWPFVLPAALLAFMAGFSGHIAWWHAVMLLALGASILSVWLQSAEAPDYSSETQISDGPALLITVAMAPLLILGGYFAVRGTLVSSQNARWALSPGTLAATILGPLLALPTLGTATAVAQRGHPGRALSALVGTVLLNLCVVLPIAVVLWYLNFHVSPSRSPHFEMHLENFLEIRPAAGHTHAVPYAMATWRIETIALVVLGFALVPVSMGRWVIGRLESSLLILAYIAYILVLVVYAVAG